MKVAGKFATTIGITTILLACLAAQAQNNCNSNRERSQSGRCPEASDAKPAAATTIFSNLGSGKNLFDQKDGLPISGPSGQTTQAVALPFTPSGTVTLDGLEIRWDGSAAPTAFWYASTPITAAFREVPLNA